MTKIYVYPADMDGCGHYRLIWPAQALQAQGHDVELVLPSDRTNISAEVSDAGVVQRVFYPEDADVLVMQRVTHRYLADAISIIRQQGTAVVVDMDDDLMRIHPKNPAWLIMHPRSGKPGTVNGEHNWGHALRACENASHVTVSSTALVDRYARHGRFNILRNCVPESYLKVNHIDSEVFGWAGSLASHPDDHEQVGLAATRLQRDGYAMKIIGDPGGIKDAYRLDDEPLTSGIVKIAEWPEAMSTLGVGMAPLAPSQFNEAKSWLKPLEMAAVGVPFVMSRSAEYDRFRNTFKIGIQARKQNEWYGRLSRFLQSKTLREDTSGLNREAVSVWTYEQRAEQWAAAWLRAAESR